MLMEIKKPLLATLGQFFKLLKQYTNKNALLFALGIGLSLAIASCTASNSANPSATGTSSEPIRIGFQKYGTLSIVRAQGNLEKRLAESGVTVQWLEFPAGPPLLEALNAGSIDFGHTGETPPIFAQAAGAPLVYVGSEPPAPKAEAILVSQDSPIKSVADLKGRRIVFAKGSNVHYLVVQALASVGLKLSDVQATYLLPADARAAFQSGNADAWGIWDPFLAVAQKDLDARILTDGEGLVANREFYLAAQNFANQRSDQLQLILDEIQQVDKWAASRPNEVAQLLSPLIGIDVQTLETVARRRPYGLQPITAEVVTYQQSIADTFYGQKLIPKQISVKDVTGYQNNQG